MQPCLSAAIYAPPPGSVKTAPYTVIVVEVAELEAELLTLRYAQCYIRVHTRASFSYPKSYILSFPRQCACVPYVSLLLLLLLLLFPLQWVCAVILKNEPTPVYRW